MTEQRRRVLILGASGHLGGLVWRACQQHPELEALPASSRPRPGWVQLDLNQPETFSAAEDAQVVLNFSDTARAWPLPFARWCVERGIVFMEGSADPECFRQLFALRDHPGEGCVVMGAGAFPGLSTLLLEAGGAERELELRLSWSVLSGAGEGTVEIMLSGLSDQALTVEQGREQLRPPMHPVARRELGAQPRWVIPMSMPDVVIAAQGLGLESMAFQAWVRPSLPGWMLRVTAWCAARGLFSLRPLRWALGRWLQLLRALIFRKRTTSLLIELHSPGGCLAALRAEDGMQAGAEAAAIQAARWPLTLSGVRLPHEGLSLESTLTELAGSVERLR